MKSARNPSGWLPDGQAKAIYDQTSVAGCFMLKPDSVPRQSLGIHKVHGLHVGLRVLMGTPWYPQITHVMDDHDLGPMVTTGAPPFDRPILQ